MSLIQLLLYCRPGFEKECAAEIVAQTAALGLTGYCKAKAESGYVVFVPTTPDCREALARIAPLDLIFARQSVVSPVYLQALPVNDRLAVLLPAIHELGTAYSALRLETADTNDAKELSVFLRQFALPLRQALQRAGIDCATAGAPVLHLFFLSSTAVYVGCSDPARTAPWLMGIPRLKFPPAAPSRATLKLEEALLLFLDDAQRARLLQAGMRAVDLGAAPGGWTWQLVRRGLRVTAIDNGAIARNVLDSGLVEHLRVDGLRYRPPTPVDWLVCDMAEQPARIATLVGRWLAQGWCRHAIFNLKLPMKQRYEEVLRCRRLLESAVADTRYTGRLRIKQLYHDREEVTACVLAE